MDRYIAEENIKHFRSLLATELNEQRRQCILSLLADEEAKLRLIRAAEGAPPFLKI
jgi:hypothetical protein